MSAIPPSKWCGQSQPHNPHTWVMPGRIGFYAYCGGHK